MIMPEQEPPPGPGAAEGDLSAAVTELAAEVAAVRADRASGHLLDLAAGILVAQLSVTPSDAADHLLRLAASTGLSPEDLAADIVNAASGTVVAAPAEDGEGVAQARRARRAVASAETGDTIGDVAVTLLEGGLRPLGVQALWLWRLTATDCLQLAGHAGVSASEASHWQWIPPEAGARCTARWPRRRPPGSPPGRRRASICRGRATRPGAPSCRCATGGWSRVWRWPSGREPPTSTSVPGARSRGSRSRRHGCSTMPPPIRRSPGCWPRCSTCSPIRP
ncbi:ANTAR domain-containing protein [Streptomyces sp. NBC_01142]|uniref:ANTAR domain-containing protein n=1 Tax=Streptomyces sp. NBC_01142 TaxID=2975865 RepID=UPI002259FD4E|nr:ANTAR domain-containing protein [Streptomyces sp. NBC_01142]MCX4825492.1 ANTAR domain-containing protein [Streptomyces sp. NBC_01142]